MTYYYIWCCNSFSLLPITEIVIMCNDYAIMERYYYSVFLTWCHLHSWPGAIYNLLVDIKTNLRRCPFSDGHQVDGQKKVVSAHVMEILESFITWFRSLISLFGSIDIGFGLAWALVKQLYHEIYKVIINFILDITLTIK